MKMSLAIAALFGSCGFVVLAQTIQVTDRIPYAKEGALVAVLGSLIWSLQYLLRDYLPKQQGQFTKTLAEIVAREDEHRTKRLEEGRELKDAIMALRDNCRDFQRSQHSSSE